jgi:hypothetical protein
MLTFFVLGLNTQWGLISGFVSQKAELLRALAFAQPTQTLLWFEDK